MSTDPRALPTVMGRRGGPTVVPPRIQEYQQIAALLGQLFGTGGRMAQTPFRRAGAIPAIGHFGGVGGRQAFDPQTGQNTRLALGAIPVSAFNALSDAQRNMLQTAGIFNAPGAGDKYMQANLDVLRKLRDPRVQLAPRYNPYYNG